MRNLLRQYREKAGLSRAKLGAEIGADRSSIWRYENGRMQPSDEKKVLIANVLDGTVQDIFFPEVEDELEEELSDQEQSG